MKSTHYPLLIGIMSGTSADGIDVAVMRFGARPELVYFSEHVMPGKLQQAIFRLTETGFGEIDNMGGLSRALGYAYADAVHATLADAGLQASDISAIGNHGQTIRHRPDTKYPFSLQTGCPATLAESTGITTVSDFRSRDIAAGGQGAPLVPFAHRALFAQAGQNTAVLNIGGIANITWLGSDGTVTGFDTGPGNMIMDGLILRTSDGLSSFDKDGAVAASGQICQPLLDQLMQQPYFNRTPPKSTGREAFGQTIVQQILDWPDLSDADRLTTACQFTVAAIADCRRFLPGPPERWLICGGGARNPYLMQQLAEALSPADVCTTDEAGMPAQAVEAASFAILARQTLAGQINTLASVTGARHNVCGGQITPGSNWQTLLQEIPNWIR